MSTEVDIRELAKAVECTHGGRASWLRSTPVREEHEGRPVWVGEVQTFRLVGHQTATTCYAWSYVSDATTGRRKFYAVLAIPPIVTAADAVRAAIAADAGSG
jgi:hypothetical protein